VIFAGVARGRWRLAQHQLFPPARAAGTGLGRFRGLVGLALALTFALLVVGALTTVFSRFKASGLGVADAGGALALVLVAAVAGLAVFDLHFAVSALLLDSDLELLRRAPLSPVALLALKLCDSLPRTTALLGVVGLPAVVAFALSYRLPAWAWLALPLQLVALWAVPLGVGIALALWLVHVVPPRRARDALGLLSTLVIALLWIANSFLLPRLGAEGDDLRRRWSGALHAPAALWVASPAHWMAGAVMAAHRRQPAVALGWTALLGLAGALSLGAATLAAGRYLDTALAHAAHPVPRRRQAPAAATGQPRHALRRHVIATLIVRDARLFARDWTVLSDVLVAAALWTLLPLVGAPLHAASPRMVTRAMLLALTVGLGYEVAARSVPFERDGLAWCRLAPVAAWRWVAAKWLGAGMFSLAMMGVAGASLALAFPLGPAEWIETTIVGVSALALSLSLGLWTGALFGDPGWTNPRAMLTLAGRLSASGLLVLQAGAWLGLLAVADSQRAQLPAGALLWGPPVVSGLLCLAPLSAVARWVRRFEWTR
jgi:ABC-2 type transport system permease protein